MANTDKISDVVDSKAFEQVTKLKQEVKDLTDVFVELLKSVSSSGIDVKGIKGLQEETAKVNKETEELEKTQKQLIALEQKRIIAESELGKKLAEQKIILQQLNKENANTAKLRLTEAGSISRLEAVRDKLLAKQKALNRETEEGAKKNELYKKSLNRINEEIAKGRDNKTLQSFNVGNYAGSLAKPFESLQREISRLKSTPLTAVPGGRLEDTQAAGRASQISELDKILVKASRDGINATQQVKLLEAAFQKLSLAADPADKEMQDFLKNFKKEVGSAKDAVQDLKDEIKLNASDTKGVDNVVSSLSALAGVAQGAAGAYALFGGSEEEVAAITSKLIAVQGIANSVQQVGQELTRKGTTLNKIYAATVESIQTVFSSGSTAAQRFGVAINSIGILALVAGVATLVIAMANVINKMGAATEEQKAFRDVTNEAAGEMAKATSEVKAMGTAFEQAKSGVISKELALKKYNDGIGQVIGQAETLEQAESLYNSKAKDYVTYMGLRAQAAAAFALAQKKAEEVIKNQAATTEDLVNFWDKIKANFKGTTLKSLFTIDANQVKNSANELSAIGEKKRQENDAKFNADVDRYNKIGNDITAKADEAQAKSKLTNAEQVALDKENERKRKEQVKKIADDQKKAAEEAKKIREAIAKFNAKIEEDNNKASGELGKLKVQQASDVFKQISEDEKKSYAERILANGFYYATLEEIQKKEADNEKAELIRKTIAERQAIDGKVLSEKEAALLVATQLQAIEAENQNKLFEIRRNGIAQQNELIEGEASSKLEKISEQSAKELSQLEINEANELALLNNKFSSKKITLEQFEKEAAEIKEKYALLKLQKELEYAEKLLAIAKASGTDTTEQEKNIANIKLKIAEEAANGEKKISEKSLADQKAIAAQKKQLWSQLGTELKNTIFAFVDAGFERQKNNLEREKVVIDERKEAELKRINALQISEEEKADKIKILDANTQAEKERIARRQKQLDIQKAKFDKFKSIADIGINTASGIVKTIAQVGMPAAIPFIALISAIGALQLAQVIATKIPEYWKGTDDHPGGLAWVGERKKELGELPDGTLFETPGTKTLMNLPKGTKITPHEKYVSMLDNEETNKVLSGKKILSADEFLKMQYKINERGNTEIVEAIKNSPKAVVNITPYGIDVLEKQGHSWKNYIDKKVKMRS